MWACGLNGKGLIPGDTLKEEHVSRKECRKWFGKPKLNNGYKTRAHTEFTRSSELTLEAGASRDLPQEQGRWSSICSRPSLRIQWVWQSGLGRVCCSHGLLVLENQGSEESVCQLCLCNPIGYYQLSDWPTNGQEPHWRSTSGPRSIV
jgi:hypothetical protein